MNIKEIRLPQKAKLAVKFGAPVLVAGILLTSCGKEGRSIGADLVDCERALMRIA